MRIVVVLPAPFGPSRPNASPSSMSNVIPRTASKPPANVLRRSSHSRMGTRQSTGPARGVTRYASNTDSTLRSAESRLFSSRTSPTSATYQFLHI